MQEGDRIFIIIERRQIKEAKFFAKTGCNDDSIWAVWPEHWEEDRESMCFCCQQYQWAASYPDAVNKLKGVLVRQKQELINQVEAIDSILSGLVD